MPRAPKIQDGLNKHSQYYRNHPEIREKNRLRQRARRAQQGQAQQEPRRQPHRLTPEELSVNNQYTLINSPTLPHSPATISHAGVPSTNPHAAHTSATAHMLLASNMASTDCVSEGGVGASCVCEGGDVLCFTAMHHKVMEWCSLWGGYKVWSYGLVARYHDALDNNMGEHFIRQVRQHAKRGRHLIQTLQDLEGDLPANHCEIKELWVLYTKLLEILFEGTMVLELRTSFFPHDYTNFLTLHKLHKLCQELGQPTHADRNHEHHDPSARSVVIEQDLPTRRDLDPGRESAGASGHSFTSKYNNRDDRTQFIYMWRRNIHLIS